LKSDFNKLRCALNCLWINSPGVPKVVDSNKSLTYFTMYAKMYIRPMRAFFILFLKNFHRSEEAVPI